MSATQCAATPQRGTATVALLVLAAPPAAWAGSWAVEPRLGVAAEYSSNPQLLDSAAEGYFGALDLSLPTAWDDGARQVALAPHARFVSAGGPSGSGRNAYSMGASMALASESSQWSAAARWADESTATVEPAAGTLTQVDVPRVTRALGLDWNRAFTPRIDGTASLDGTDVSYSRGERFGLYDYRSIEGSGSVSYALDERRKVQLVGGASRYQMDRDTRSTRSAYLQLGTVGAIDELWSYTLLYGWSQTRTGRGASPSGAVYLAKLGRGTERLTLTASATRSFLPSGFGTITRSTDETLTIAWRQSERSRLSVTGRHSRTRDAFGSLDLARRTYEFVSAGWTYQATEAWSFDATVDWRRQKVGQFFFAAAVGQGTGIALSATRRFGRTPLAEIGP